MTSFFIPAARPASIARASRIVNPEVAMVVVHGAAGTGKSMLLAEHARSLGEAGLDVVWVSLNQDDSGHGPLLARIADRLARANLIDDEALDTLLTGEPSAVARQLERRMEARRRPLVLVIDDYHHVADRAADETLLQFVERGVVSLLVATRHPDSLQTPRSAARVETQLIDSRTLAFTVGEVSRLLVASGISESDAVAGVIHRATRGWPLATYALAVEASRGTLDLTGAARGRFARDIVESTIAQDPRLLAFAVIVSLADQITVPLAHHLTGQSEEDITRALVRLESAGLGSSTGTAIRGGVENLTFAFHPLVQEELSERARRQLDPEALRDALLVVAADLSGRRVGRAFELLIEARAWEQAEQHLKHNYGVLTALNRSLVVAALERVPRDVLAEYPVLAGTRTLLDFGDRGSIGARLRQGLTMMTTLWRVNARPPDGLDGLAQAALAMGAYRLSGDAAHARKLADAAIACLDRLPEDDLDENRTIIPTILTQVAITYLYLDDFPAATRHVQTVLALVEKGGTPGQKIHALSILAMAQAVRGDMAGAAQSVAEAETVAGPAGWTESYYGAGYRIARSYLALERGDALAADAELDALDAHPNIEHWPYIAELRARASMVRAGPEAGLASLGDVLTRMRGRPAPVAPRQTALWAARAELLVLAGQVSRAEKAVAQEESDLDAPSLNRARVALARHELVRAETVASQIVWRSHETPRRHAEALLVKAAVLWMASEHEQATQSFARARAVMADHSLSTPVLGATQSVLREIASASGIELGALDVFPRRSGDFFAVQSLSRAEAAVLAMFMDGGTVREAAARLHIADGTVRFHLKRSYKKLGVNSRADAVRRAVELGLLSRTTDVMSG